MQILRTLLQKANRSCMISLRVIMIAKWTSWSVIGFGLRNQGIRLQVQLKVPHRFAFDVDNSFSDRR